MKNIFIAILFLSFLSCFAQKKTIVKKEPVKQPVTLSKDADFSPNALGPKEEVQIEYSQIFTTVDVLASPPGGINAYRKHIASSFKFPEVDYATKGSVIARFIIWDDGSIRDIQIIKEEPLGLGLGKEYIRILKNSEKWTPGQLKGKNVKQYYTLPVSFQIAGEDDEANTIEVLKKEEAPIVTESETTLLDKQAEPVGGIKKFYTELSSNLQVPDTDVAGTYKTKVKFLVNQDGSLSDFQVIEEKPSNVGLGQNVIKYLQGIEKWIPGEQNGRKVKTYFVLPVTTVIENEPTPELKKDKK